MKMMVEGGKEGKKKEEKRGKTVQEEPEQVEVDDFGGTPVHSRTAFSRNTR